MMLRAGSGTQVRIGRSTGILQVVQKFGEEDAYPISMERESKVLVNDCRGFDVIFEEHPKWWKAMLRSKSTTNRSFCIPGLTLSSEASKFVEFNSLLPYLSEEKYAQLSSGFEKVRSIRAEEMIRKEEVLPYSFHVGC